MPIGKKWPHPLSIPGYYQERDFTPLLRTPDFTLQALLSKPAASWISPLEGLQGSSNQTCPKESIVLPSNSILPSGPATHPAACHHRFFSILHSPSPGCQFYLQHAPALGTSSPPRPCLEYVTMNPHPGCNMPSAWAPASTPPLYRPSSTMQSAERLSTVN